jgi:hypothetical protein
MSSNVAETIEGRQSTLFEKLSSNNDLANVIMAFLGKIVLMCHQRGKPIQGVETTDVVEVNDEFRFGLSFNDLVITPMGIWQNQGSILHYAQSRSVHLAKALERNGKIMRTFTQLVEAVEKRCQRKGMSFKDFKLKKAIIHPKTDTCIIKCGIPDFNDNKGR